MKSFARVVALGDSMLSDCYPGPGLGSASLLWRNADKRFPEFAGRDLSHACPQADFSNLSRTGWLLDDLLEKARALAPDPRPTLVLMVGGGNDVLHWLMDGNEPEALFAQLEQKYLKLRSHLESLFPQLTLRVGNVYDPTDGSGRVQSGRYVGPALDCVELLNELLARLFAGVVDIHRHFLGHGVRHQDPEYEHYHPDDPSGWIKMDIEPNPRGASEIRRLFWASL